MARTTCHLCESACGFLASMEAGQLRFQPDREHPVSKGYACAKGLSFPERLRADRRLIQPLLHQQAVTTEQALSEIGARLRRIAEETGPESIGFYLGNATIHNLGAVLGTYGLAKALGARTWSSLSLDNSAQVVVSEMVFGSPLVSFIADYQESDRILLIGTDPLASQPSQSQSHPDGIRQLLRAADRLVVVDPRRSMTARKAALHLAPRPGTDPFLLAFLLKEVIEEVQAGRRSCEATGLPALWEAVKDLRLPNIAEVCGLEPAQIQALSEMLRRAERPLVWSGLGVLLGPEGSLGWWLTLCLQTVLGGLNRRGGWRYVGGALPMGKLAGFVGLKGRDFQRKSPVSGLPEMLGSLPAAEVPAEMEGGRLRALLVFGGNPMRSLPDRARVKKAFSMLDTLVVCDIFPSETTERATAVLPAAAWPERWNSTVHLSYQRAIGHVSQSDALLSPPGAAQSDWDWCLALAQAAGRPLFGNPLADWTARKIGLKRMGEGILQFGALLSSGRQTDVHGVRTADRDFIGEKYRLNLAPPELVDRLRQLRPPPTAPLHLITSIRSLDRLNTWINAEQDGARLHPDDLARYAPGGILQLPGPSGPVSVRVTADPSLRPGTLAWPFGDGEANALVPADRLDPLGATPCSNGLGLFPVG